MIHDDAWQRAAAEVPDKARIDALRIQLEAAGARFVQAKERRAFNEAEANRWAEIERHASALLVLLPSGDESSSRLKKLAKRARLKARAFGVRADLTLEQMRYGARVRPADLPRLVLYREVLDAYVAAGGQVARSTDAHGKSGGPCVRFLAAVLPQLMGADAPSPNSLENLVKDWWDRPRHPAITVAHGHVTFKK
ncbi:hypothetical protein [Xanthobacter tagetidis]|uniref:hypothetical protein n=1 Tax=Xanthobacter tagetidis TaxID=60216 RepID=UPI0011C3B572|nr:hypothetical protein [Xanthobacter tagetidis]MBB6305995.1 hypothetical protein [Xanthobacter tagetidis]